MKSKYDRERRCSVGESGKIDDLSLLAKSVLATLIFKTMYCTILLRDTCIGVKIVCKEKRMINTSWSGGYLWQRRYTEASKVLIEVS